MGSHYEIKCDGTQRKISKIIVENTLPVVCHCDLEAELLPRTERCWVRSLTERTDAHPTSLILNCSCNPVLDSH